MLTMHPSIMLGSYVLDEDRLPRDEFDIRLAPIREAMAREGIAATLVYGDARDHGALAFFTNFIPRMRWAMAIIPARGEPRLLISISSRDMPAMRTMTWIADVKSGWEWKWFDEYAATLPAGSKLATMDFDLMTPLLFGQLAKSLGDRATLVEFDDLATRARTHHRPREIALIREAARIASAAGADMAARWRAGDDVETAAVAGERAARSMAAQDVRTLVSRDNGLTLEPYRARFTDRPRDFLAYLAVKYRGYWGEAFISLPEGGEALSRANAGLDRALTSLRTSASIDALCADVVRVTGAGHPALGGSIGHRIGLSPREAPDLAPDGGTITPRNAYALRIGAIDADNRGAIVSAMVLVRDDGAAEILSRATYE